MAWAPPGTPVEMIMITPERYIQLKISSAGHGAVGWPQMMLARQIASTVTSIIDKKTVDDAFAIVQGQIGTYMNMGFDIAEIMRSKGPEGDETPLSSAINNQMDFYMDMTRAGMLAGVGTGLTQFIDTMAHTGQLIYAYKTLLYHTAVTPRMRRRWNKLFYPNWPDMRTAYTLWKRKKSKSITSLDKVVEAGRWEGWSDTMARELISIMEPMPGPKEAFYIQQKGKMTPTAMKANWTMWGWPSSLHDAMLDNFYYTPTVYDLFRMADSYELDMTWTLKQLQRRGVRASDMAVMWPILQLRPLREEMRLITNQWLWRYRYARATEVEFKQALIDLGLKTKERELLWNVAQLYYQDELIDEMVQILMWRFRAGDITATEYQEMLEELGIKTEKANLMVQEQQAMGYPGGY